MKYAVSRLDMENSGISDDDNILKGLNNFYEMEYCKILNDYRDIQYEASDFIPGEKKFKFLQYYYLVKNTNDLFEKEKLTSSSGNMVYDQMHEYYHTFFRGYINDYHIDDLLLIDNESGDIIYTVRKLGQIFFPVHIKIQIWLLRFVLLPVPANQRLIFPMYHPMILR
jgi:hypothetical protein